MNTRDDFDPNVAYADMVDAMSSGEKLVALRLAEQLLEWAQRTPHHNRFAKYKGAADFAYEVLRKQLGSMGAIERPVSHGFEWIGADNNRIARIRECIGGCSWSVVVSDVNWRIPEGHPTRLLYPSGWAWTIHVGNEAEARQLVEQTLRARYLGQPLPLNARKGWTPDL